MFEVQKSFVCRNNDVVYKKNSAACVRSILKSQADSNKLITCGHLRCLWKFSHTIRCNCGSRFCDVTQRHEVTIYKRWSYCGAQLWFWCQRIRMLLRGQKFKISHTVGISNSSDKFLNFTFSHTVGATSCKLNRPASPIVAFKVRLSLCGNMWVQLIECHTVKHVFEPCRRQNNRLCTRQKP